MQCCWRYPDEQELDRRLPDVKRDMDLIRKLILQIEDRDGPAQNELNIDGYSGEQIGYHAYLLVDSGLAEGIDATHMGSAGPQYIISRLTWAGHDFADACRDDSRWTKAKATVKDKAGSVTFDVMKELLVSLIKSSMGLA